VKHHVIRRQWLAVAPAQVFPQLERPGFAVRRIRPRFGQGRFDLLRNGVLANQTGEQMPDNFLGCLFVGRDGVECFRIAIRGDDEASARYARRAGGDQRRFRQRIIRRRISRRSRSGFFPQPDRQKIAAAEIIKTRIKFFMRPI
jgi:hypothetical protein